MNDEAPQLKARLKKLMSKREALKEITKRPGAGRSGDLVREKERLEGILDELVIACHEGHALRERREELGYQSELVIQALHRRLSRIYKALTEGGKPSDYERTKDS